VAQVESLTAARAFELVWSTLVGVLGTGATATMFRRAVRRSAGRNRPERIELQGLEVTRDGFDYRFVLPPAWTGDSEASLQALRYFIREELYPLLEELTGPVIIRLLERQPELQRSGVIAERGDRRPPT
jgi:hypothetical protein